MDPVPSTSRGPNPPGEPHTDDSDWYLESDGDEPQNAGDVGPSIIIQDNSDVEHDFEPLPNARPGQVEFVWNHNEPSFMTRHGFSANSGVNDTNILTAQSTPREIFHQFVTDDIMEYIVRETNHYAHTHEQKDGTHTRKWSDTNKDEMETMFALRMLMGIVQKPKQAHYWSTHRLLKTSIFPETMPRDRYDQLIHNLHFARNEVAVEGYRLVKLRPITVKLNERFRCVYTPSRDISIDESLWKFKGRLSFRQFNPQKRARFGVKVYKLATSCGPAAGYTSSFQIYTGKGQGSGHKVVMDMMSATNCLDKGYNLYVDNWYTSPALFTELHARKTNVVGTVRRNRKGMPKDLGKCLKNRGDIDYYSSDTGLLAIAWRDKKDVKSGYERRSNALMPHSQCFLAISCNSCDTPHDLGH